MKIGRRGQSEVIGVILLVAIVTIIAAAAGIFIIDIATEGTDSEVGPQTSFDAEQFGNEGEERKIRLSHDGGETLDAEQVNFTVADPDGEFAAPEFGGTEFPDEEITSQDAVYIAVDEDDDTEVVVKNEISAVGDDDPLPEGTEITVIWDAEDADQTQILFESTVESR